MGAVLARACTPGDARPGTARAIMWASVVASNAPDLDFVAGAAGNLAYLLHHRGWTHTILAVPLVAAASTLVGLRAGRGDPMPIRRIAAVASAAAALHIAADGANNYGVHPFAPFWNGWLHGDTLFIIEPLLWLAMLPLVFAVSSRIARAISLLVGIAVLALVWLGPFVPLPVAAFVTAWGAAFVIAQRRLRGRPVAAIAGVLVVILAFAAAGGRARAIARDALARAAPSERHPVVSSRPAPANPFCWEILSVSFGDDRYRARSGFVSLAPSWFAPASCDSVRGPERTAPVAAPDLPDGPRVDWTRSFHGRTATLRELLEDCRMAALLRFARTPYWIVDGDAVTAGDLRYDFQPSLDFAEIAWSRDEPCPRGVPPWRPPLSIPPAPGF